MFPRPSYFSKLFPLFLAGVFLLSSQPTLAEFAPDNSTKADPLASQKQMQGVSVGEFTGAALYQYPISVPAGRNGLTPSISLTYNSQDESLDSPVGYHWSLDQYSIRRINKKGVEKLYDQHDFTASTPFESGELTDLSLNDGQHGDYAQRFESSFAHYQFLPDNSWLVTDKQGNHYTFGTTDQSRQFDPTDASRTSEWMLEEIRDPNDNFIHFSYQKIDQQLYPDQITYTGHGAEEGIFRIKFLISQSVRPDSSFSYATGFRVDSNHLITGVEIYTHDVLRHRYDFAYTSVNPLVRQTIGSVTETGYDSSNSPTILPPTTFDYSQSDVSWEEATDYAPSWIFENCNEDWGSCEIPNFYMWDMTGDGLVDFEYTTDNVTFSRAINDGKGGFKKVPATFFTSFFSPRVPSIETKALDFNGDLTPEIIHSWKNNDGSISSDPNIEVPFLFGQAASKQDNGSSIADLNGDNLPDVIQKRSFFTGHGGISENATCLNDGQNSCSSTDLWQSPEVIVSDRDFDQLPRQVYVQDCNYDGLADVHFAGSGPRDWINDGKGGWVLNPAGTCQFSQLDYLTRRSADVNGDGLEDGIISERTILPVGAMVTNELKISMGNGKTAAPLTNRFPITLGTTGNAFNNDDGVRILDLDGDQLPDIMQSKKYYDGKGNTTFTQKVFMNKGSRPYFLKTVHSSTGAQIDLDYKTSAQYFKPDGSQANPNLPIIVDTVSRMTVDDGMGNVSETNYFYEDGHYYFENSNDRSFAGFRVVTKTDGLGYQTKTYYHQDQHSVDDSVHGEYQDHISKKGHPYRTETYDQNGQLMADSLNRFDFRILGANHYFPFLSQTLSQTFDGGVTKSVAKAFTYDDVGNPIQTVDFGEVLVSAQDGSFVDTGNDLLKTVMSFISQTAYPFESKTFDQTSSLLSNSKTYYDHLSLGQVDKGNATAQEIFLDVSNSWVRSEAEYDDYGLSISSKNPRGFITQTDYDGDHLYPATVTNAKGQTVSMTYDPAIGQAITTTDPNGVTTDTTYDGLGRKKQVQINGTLMTTSDYNDQAWPHSAHSTAYNDDGQTVESYVYIDGLGRTIESKQEASGGQWTTSQSIYDERGNLEKSIQPYFSAGSNFEPLDAGKIGNSFTYDALGRMLSSTNPLGTSSSVYVGFEVTTTDPNGKDKTMASDARGHLLRVDEKEGGNTLQTLYTYDTAGRLRQVRDAQNNERAFRYDSLGHRLFESQLVVQGKPLNVGWSYSYDANGNVTEKKDPKNQTITFTYDELDRPLTQNNLTFTYDQGDYGVGRLSKVEKPSYGHQVTYDFLGRVITDHKTIGEKNFDFSYAYDQLGGLTSLTYPDQTVALSNYDSAHQLRELKVGDTPFANAFEYTPTGQLTQMTMGNGVTVKNTYDPNQLYRLTTKTASNDLENYQYTYDAVGNLNQLVDAGVGKTAKTVNYQYDDLYRLTQAAYTLTANQKDVTENYHYDAIGNMMNKSDVGDFGYDNPQPQAVTTASTHVYDYDANGNMTVRDGNPLVYDELDRLIQFTGKATFTYGEGYDRLTKTDVATGGITYYPSQYFEVHPDKEIKYIYAGSERIAKMEKELAVPVPPSPPADPQGGDGGNDVQGGGNDANGNGDGQGAVDPGADGNPNPLPPAVVPPRQEVPSQGSGGGGSYGSQDQLKLMRLIAERKKAEAEGKKISLYPLKAIKEQKENGPMAGLLPENPFKNLSIAYDEKTALITWDAMPKDIVSFKIYRSKGDHATALDPTSVFLEEVKASRFGNSFTHHFDRADSSYAYHIEALDKKGKRLINSMTLHSRQIFLKEGEEKLVDFSGFSKTDFSNIRIKGNTFVSSQETKFTKKLLLKPADDLKTGARLQVNFLTCSVKKDGSLFCKKLDDQFIEVYILTKSHPLQAATAFLTDQVSHLAAAFTPEVHAEEQIAPPAEKTYYFLNDHLGSVDTVLDDKGNIVEQRDFLPFGSERVTDEEGVVTNTSHKFTGKELDDETGLYYYGARYYDPVIGRFISADPWGGDLSNPQTLNKYSYVTNNPVRYVDPTGEKLELSGSDTFTDKAFADLMLISPYITRDDNKISFDYKNAASDFLDKHFKNPLGSVLLMLLINDDNIVKVNQLEDRSGGDSGVAENDRNFFGRLKLKYGKGVDSFVKYNQDSLDSTWIYNSETKDSEKKESPSYITLAHELIHALHYVLGGMEKDKDVIYKTVNGALDTASKEEVRTVGTDSNYKKEGDVTENDIRRENGLELRNNY